MTLTILPALHHIYICHLVKKSMSQNQWGAVVLLCNRWYKINENGQETDSKGAFRHRWQQPARSRRASATLMKVHSFLLMPLRVYDGSTFFVQLAAVARCVTMATTETTKSWFYYLSSLNYIPPPQQRAERSIKRNITGATSASKFDYLVSVYDTSQQNVTY